MMKLFLKITGIPLLLYSGTMAFMGVMWLFCEMVRYAEKCSFPLAALIMTFAICVPFLFYELVLNLLGALNEQIK